MFDMAREENQSEFNSGIAIIYRLDSIHKHLHIAKHSRNHEFYMASLRSLFVEMYRVMDKKEKELHLKYYFEVRKYYFRIRFLKKLGKSIPAMLFESFFVWELELTLLEQRYNLGMPRKPDSRFALAH